MRRLVVSIAVITAVSLSAIALGQGFKKISEILSGYEETATTGGGAVSTTGNGTFTARISNDESRIDWELSYADLEGAVQQAHIHFWTEGSDWSYQRVPLHQSRKWSRRDSTLSGATCDDLRYHHRSRCDEPGKRAWH